MRSIYKPNQFEVSIRVLDTVNKTFNCDLNIKSKSHSLSLKLKYDHEDQQLPAGYFDEKIEETQEKPKPKKLEKLEIAEPSFKDELLKKPKKVDSKEGKSWFSQIFLVALMILVALSMLDIIDINRVISNLFQGAQTWFRVNQQDQTQEFYSAQGERSSIGF